MNGCTPAQANRQGRGRFASVTGAIRPLILLALVLLPLTLPAKAQAEPWAPGQEPAASESRRTTAAEALALETLRRQPATAEQRRRYLNAAQDLLERFWTPRQPVRLLLAGERASGCGAPVVQHPMAFYCPASREIGLALDLRRSIRAARGRSDQDLLLLELAILAHEWGHHINREQGLGPYRGGLGLTARQEELAADWRTGILIGWLLRTGAIGVDDFTQTANLLFEMGDYERLAPQHHGYPRDRFDALIRGMGSQIRPGQQLGSWSVDTAETFSRPLSADGGIRLYDVRRFEINREGQITTNLLGGLLGAASCLWGSREQCLGMALQQGKGRADGRYTQRRLTLHCAAGRFDVSDDAFEEQPLGRDGKGQAAVLAARDCPASADRLRAGGS